MSLYYKYSALHPDGFFRYFVLEPGEGQESLRGSLKTSKLDEAPYFEAISYVWGSWVRCVELICDSKQILITPSLSEVLHRVRFPDRPRTLWTDSVCINQDDLDEKGSQVALMGGIYRRSNRTLIYVGAHDDGHAEPTLMLMRDIEREFFASLTQEWDSAPFIDEDHSLIHDVRWKSFQHLVSTPWFKRGWVVQEAAHAQDGLVLWGTYELPWTTIMKTAVWMLRRAFQIALRLENDIPALHIFCFGTLHQDAIRPFSPRDSFWNDFNTVLYTFQSGRQFGVSDPRDRIYAFYDLPASDRSDKLQIVPSYHKSFPEVCRDLALNYLDVYDDLNILLYVSHDEDSIATDFASWIPLWGPEKYRCEGLQTHYVKRAPLLGRQQPKFSLGPRGETIQLSGLRYAKIKMVSEVFQEEQLTQESIADLWSEVSRWHFTQITADRDHLAMFLTTFCSGIIGPETRMYFRNMAAFGLKLFDAAADEEERAMNYQRWEAQANGGDPEKFLSWARRAAVNRRFVVTDRGYGMAPALAQADDECVIIIGGKAPFLLRKVGGAGNFKLIGHMFHSGEKEYEVGDTGWHTVVDLEYGKDWGDWDIEEEAICLL